MKKSNLAEQAAPQSSQQVTIKYVAGLVGVHEITIHRWARNRADFPKPKRLGPNCVRFDLAEVQDWLSKQ